MWRERRPEGVPRKISPVTQRCFGAAQLVFVVICSEVHGLHTAASAQSVRLVMAFAKGRGTLRCGKELVVGEIPGRGG